MNDKKLREVAARWRFVRDLLAIEDIERLAAEGNPAPMEEESVKTDEAVDRLMATR